MGYLISSEKIDQILSELGKDYRIFAPKRLAGKGRGAGKCEIRYGQAESWSGMVFDEKSHYSPKEVFYPIVQTLLHFRNDECIETSIDGQKDAVIFLRPCDLHGIKRLDKIFMENGGQADHYYARMREKIKLFVVECGEGWDSCFCVSMGTNETEQYDGIFRIIDDGILAEISDNVMKTYFEKAELTGEADAIRSADYVPEFVQKNKKEVRVPDISRDMVKDIVAMPYWDRFDEKCISCGGCNTVCISCSCFDTVDVVYDETSRDGERRRVWSSCMLDEFSTMAGGHTVRGTVGSKMRFKTLHKIYDYRLRFGGDENMCVGCGRCDMWCPQEISFSETINGLSDELEVTR